MKPKEQAQLDTQDWNEVEVLRASLREHMAEIHRLRAAGQNAINTLFAIRDGATGLWGDDLHRCNNALDHLIADFAEQPVTDCKEGDKLAPPLDVPETNFGNMAQAVDSTEADHSPDATKMVASVRADRTVEATIKQSLIVEPVATSQESRQVEPIGYFSINSYGNWEQNESGYGTPLYTAPPKREPLTNEEIQKCVGEVDDARLSGPITKLIRAVERAHGIEGEE